VLKWYAPPREEGTAGLQSSVEVVTAPAQEVQVPLVGPVGQPEAQSEGMRPGLRTLKPSPTTLRSSLMRRRMQRTCVKQFSTLFRRTSSLQKPWISWHEERGGPPLMKSQR
jgi:hypothetical protein